MINQAKNILIILLGAIGDVTRALPLAVRIKQQLPDTKITWAIEPKSSSVIDNHPAIDQRIVFRRSEGLAGYFRFVRELKQQQFDLVLDLQRHLKSGLTSYLTGAPSRIGFNPQNSKEFNWLFNNYHIDAVENFSSKFDHYQKFADLLGLSKLEKIDFGVYPNTDLQENILSRMKERLQNENVLPEKSKRIAFFLGSSWPSRFWEVNYYQELAKKLHLEQGVISVLIGAGTEREFANQFIADLGNTPFVDMVEQVSLSELFQLLMLVEYAVGPDCGPMHMAAAVNVPVISMWGSTSPQRSAPYGSQQYVIQSPIGCAPCYLRECPGLDRLCMKQITPAVVAAYIQQVRLDMEFAR